MQIKSDLIWLVTEHFCSAWCLVPCFLLKLVCHSSTLVTISYASSDRPGVVLNSAWLSLGLIFIFLTLVFVMVCILSPNPLSLCMSEWMFEWMIPYRCVCGSTDECWLRFCYRSQYFACLGSVSLPAVDNWSASWLVSLLSALPASCLPVTCLITTYLVVCSPSCFLPVWRPAARTMPFTCWSVSESFTSSNTTGLSQTAPRRTQPPRGRLPEPESSTVNLWEKVQSKESISCSYHNSVKELDLEAGPVSHSAFGYCFGNEIGLRLQNEDSYWLSN